MQKIFFAIFCLLLCRSVTADVYKWVDENGKTRFSDKAPAEKPAENIESKLKKTNVDEASKNLGSFSATTTEKTEDEKALEKKKLQDLQNAIGPRCKKMKEDIQAIARGDRGSFVDESGKEELVLERDRGKKLEEWRSNYTKYGCAKLYPLD
jgi:hypothetical protein